MTNSSVPRLQASRSPFASLALTLLLLATLAFAGARTAAAQSTYATLQGTVLDATGAIIPGATVTVTNEATGSVETVHAGASGEFRVFDLAAGSYTIVFSNTGFGDQTLTHQTVLARQVVRLDGHLAAGSVATSVDVEAGNTTFSDVATVSHSLNSGDIDTLALNFRASDSTSPLYVAALTPGVQTDTNGNISVAGGSGYFTSYTIDGVSTQNVRSNGPNVNLAPSVEAISEFKVNAASNDAEFGQPSDITITTKSGTNQLHGGLYEFYQSSSFDAKNPFSTTKPHLTANDFGAYLGGPITIPHLYNGKDKTFFFVDYEGTRRPESDFIALSVPSPAFRQGNLGALCTAGFNSAGLCNNPTPGQQVYSIFGTPYANNIVTNPNPSSLAFLALYPAATGSGIVNNFQTNLPGYYQLDNIDLRLDESLSSRHHIWARFGGKDVSRTGSDGSTAYDPINGTFSNDNKVRNVVGDYTWTISSHLINELRGGYSISNFDTFYPLAAQGPAILASTGIAAPTLAPAGGNVPDIDFTDGSYAETNIDDRPRTQKNLTYDISDIFTYAFKTHALKAGFDYQYNHFEDYLTFTTGDQLGDYYFTGALLGNAYAEFIQGLPSETDYAVDGPNVEPYNHSLGFYLQDSWKAAPNLTLDYGVRYEIHSPFNDATNQLANFDPNFPGGRVVVQGQAGLNQVLPAFRTDIGSTPIVTNTTAGLPITLRNTYYGDVDPRLGLTYSPFGDSKHRTVLHAGVGFYTVPVLGSVLYSLAGVATSNYIPFIDSASQIIVFPNAFPTASNPTPDFRRANQINLKDPRQIQWNAQVEQGIGFGSVLRIGYTGSHTTQLIQSPDLNQVPANTLGYSAYKTKFGLPYPNFNAVLTRSNGPEASYNAATVEVERRYVRGLTLDANYTFAKDLSNALGAVPSADVAENGATILNRFNIGADYGNVVFNRRHRFVGTFEYALPYGRGQQFGANINPIVNEALGGWSIAGIDLWQSGPFLTPSFSGTDPSGTGVLVRGVTTAQRPDCVTGVSRNAASQSRNGWFNVNAFATPANNIGRFGNCGVGILTGPGTQTFAGTVGKNFPVTERVNLRYEAQFANLFNHTNLATPNTNITSAAFGTITNVQDANTPYGPSAGPRNLQMSLRLTF
jgi:hypothetical protein